MSKLFFLKNKLIFGPIIAILIAVVLIGVVTILFQNKSSERKLIQDTNTLTEILKENIKPAVIFEDNVAILKLIEGLKDRKIIAYSAVYDMNNLLLAEKLFSPVPIDKTRKLLAEPIESKFDENFLFTKKEIFDEGNKIATVVIITSLDSLKQELNQFIQLFSLVIFCVLVVTFTFLFFFQKSISTPILKLTQAAIDISKNKKHANLELQRTDELGVLAKVFD